MADALDSGSSESNLVQVQVLLSAPHKNNYLLNNKHLLKNNYKNKIFSNHKLVIIIFIKKLK